MKTAWFTDARYGLFIHYGLYSLLGRGEWVMNRESIPRDEIRALSQRFTAEHFDAEAICDLAVAAGMRYVVLTTMHHDGFRLYRSRLSDFSTWTTCGRDLVAETVSAARARGLRVGLYHSLNNWMDQPDSVDALEDPAAYQRFIAATHERCVELAELFPMDVFWYDGWWPFDASGWKAAELDARIRRIRPDVLFNPRNGLPGDFATPEGHMGAPSPWRPWEGCMSVNDSWGFHVGDHDWKTPGQLVGLLAAAAAGRGNLLLNIGPRGDGSVPLEASERLRAVGSWLKTNSAAIFVTTHTWSMDLQQRGDHRGDWNGHGPCTVSGNDLFVLLRRYPGRDCVLGGIGSRVLRADILGHGPVPFEQREGRVIMRLPDQPSDPICPVLRLSCSEVPSAYQTGGHRVPQVPHPHYDPCPSELAGNPGGH
ncbi:MAG: alpha-L-fucosidase [Planctomycetes bacterium]|nr:alpha-L-fucosidase [Planctomycetota bacterium]